MESPARMGLGFPLLFLRGFRAESLNQLQRDVTAADLTDLAERWPTRQCARVTVRISGRHS